MLAVLLPNEGATLTNLISMMCQVIETCELKINIRGASEIHELAQPSHPLLCLMRDLVDYVIIPCILLHFRVLRVILVSSFSLVEDP